MSICILTNTSAIDVPPYETVVVPFERERRASWVEAGALELEVYGWTRGAFKDDGGKMCAMGGVDQSVASDLGRECMSGSILEMIIGGDAQMIMHWNDQPERTVEEVTFFLRWRAEEIRDGLWDVVRNQRSHRDYFNFSAPVEKWVVEKQLFYGPAQNWAVDGTNFLTYSAGVTEFVSANDPATLVTASGAAT